MILCLDVGNSQIYGGVFEKDKLLFTFRYATSSANTADQLGIFLKSVMRENDFDVKKIHQIAICSVVPYMDYSLRAACRKYFNIEPFVLQAGVKTGLKIKYRNPVEVGADLIATAIAAVHSNPKKNIIIIDFGTATTLCAITKDKDFLGGVIVPGMRIAMSSLESNTAKLPSVEIIKPESVIGRSTVECIQAGLYYSQLGAVREIVKRITDEMFAGVKANIIATGGFSHLFAAEKIFSDTVPDLVLQGLRLALAMN
jgi:type III pantothenate kinase